MFVCVFPTSFSFHIFKWLFSPVFGRFSFFLSLLLGLDCLLVSDTPQDCPGNMDSGVFGSGGLVAVDGSTVRRKHNKFYELGESASLSWCVVCVCTYVCGSVHLRAWAPMQIHYPLSLCMCVCLQAIIFCFVCVCVCKQLYFALCVCVCVYMQMHYGVCMCVCRGLWREVVPLVSGCCTLLGRVDRHYWSSSIPEISHVLAPSATPRDSMHAKRCEGVMLTWHLWANDLRDAGYQPRRMNFVRNSTAMCSRLKQAT